MPPADSDVLVTQEASRSGIPPAPERVTQATRGWVAARGDNRIESPMVRHGNTDKADADDKSAANSTKATAPEKNVGATLALLGGGLALTAAGCALIGLPALSRDYAWITNNFSKHGITGAPVALTGIVLCGLWIATRTRREAPAPVVEPAENLLLEQLASDMAQARGGMQDLRVEFVYLKDAVQSAAAQKQMEANSGDDPQAAVFRLAASMDQLAGRLEHRLKAQDAALHEALGQLKTATAETSTRVDELRAHIEQGIQAAQIASEAEAFDGEDEVEIETGFEPHEDDLAVYVELEEQNAGPDLGLLNQLDDFGALHSPKTSPSIRPGTPSREVAHDLFSGNGNGRGSPRMRGPLPSEPSLADVEVGTEQKIALLRELMADPAIRQALEGARRSR